MSDLTIVRLDDEGVEATVSMVRAVQRDDGAIPWFIGGRLDPWNHVEAVMALTVAGELDGARRALRWLADLQLPDGSWSAAYLENGAVLENHCDTNAVAYVATGAQLYFLVTQDRRVARELFDTVERALGFVSRHVDARGMLPWSVGPGDAISPHSLVAASASVVCSLRSGAELSSELGMPRPDWLELADRIASAISEHESAFLDKSEYAMDWYYPVLAGVLDRKRARDRIAEGLPRFLVAGVGVRCRSDGEWVTAAESAECAIACWRAGFDHLAREILECTQSLRDGDGAFRTGVVHPHGTEYPHGERTTYSSAAMVLAADVLSDGASARIFSPLS